MCHEAWWRERRARREQEPQQIWRDFEEIWPADAPVEVPDDRPDEVRLDTEKEPVTVER